MRPVNMFKYCFCIVLVLIGWIGSAQPPAWSVNPAAFSNSMVFTGFVTIDKEQSVDSLDIVAAMVGEEVRGVAQPSYVKEIDAFAVFLIVYSNQEGDSIHFQIYDHSQETIIPAVDRAVFETNELVGSLEVPYFWSNVVLGSEAELLSISFPSAQSTTISGEEVQLVFSNQDLIGEAQPSFQVSEGATVWIDGIEQVSATSVVDLSIPGIVYQVISEDKTVITTYDLIIDVVLNSEVQHSDQPPIQMYPNPVNEYFTVKSEAAIIGLKLFNLQGKSVPASVSKISHWEWLVYPDVSLSRGTYVVKVQSDQGQQVLRMLKID